MSDEIRSERSKPRLAAPMAALTLLACAGLLSACGGSSGTRTATNASASVGGQRGSAPGAPGSPGPGGTGATGPIGATGPGGYNRKFGPGGATGPGGPAGTRFRAMRECLQKNGLSLPEPGAGRRGGRGLFPRGAAGGPALPKGVSRAQLEAALRKCGPGQGVLLGRGGRLRSPAYRAALAKFATCLRENGVHVPAPNTSGNGPIFDTRGIDTASATFRAASAKCRGDLLHAFRPGPGARPYGATGATGPAGGGY